MNKVSSSFASGQLRRNGFLLDCYCSQVGRKQAQAKDVVVECILVELIAQSNLGRQSQTQQATVTVKAGSGLRSFPAKATKLDWSLIGSLIGVGPP